MKVLTGGTFDLIHLAHIRWLKQASDFGDLIVNITSDEQVINKKGNDRPIICQKDRAEVIQSLKCVKDVYLMKGLYNIEKMLDDVKPDILIVINEVDNSKELEACLKRNIEMIELPRTDVESGLNSTSQIINKIRSLQEGAE